MCEECKEMEVEEKYDGEMVSALAEASDLIRQLNYYPGAVLLVSALTTYDFEEEIIFCESLAAQISAEHGVIVEDKFPSNGTDEGWYVFIITRPEVQP